MEQGFFMDMIRGLFSVFDRIIYGTIIPMLYEFIVLLAGIDVFKENTVQDFATRVYSLLAIFMLFRISFSFITYIVNPDQMLDKAKGAGSIVKNVLIVLILMIVCPRAFGLLREVQSAILTDQLIPKFILGYNSTSEANGSVTLQYFNGDDEKKQFCGIGDSGDRTAESVGDFMSLMILKNFYNGEDRNLSAKEVSAGLSNTDFCKIKNNITAYDLFDSDIYNADKNDVYVINYWILITTAVGVVVTLYLLSSCFDIAVRAIKLGFLEIISPIPIISYIEPNSGKSGMFKKWLTEVGKTWASLFIRLAAIFFAIFVISQVEALNWNSDSAKSFTGKYGMFAELFIIIGALMFAKQLPQLIEALVPGLKLGGFQLNPLKKIANEAIGGKYVAAGTAALGVGAAGAFFAGKNKAKVLKEQDKNLPTRILRGWTQGGIGGFFRTASRTAMTGSDGSISGMRKAITTGFSSAGHAAQNVEAKEGTGKGRKAAILANMLGQKTVADKLDKIFGAMEDIEKKMKVLDDRSDNYLTKHSNLILSNGNEYGVEKKNQEIIINGKTVAGVNITARNDAQRRIANANAILSSTTATQAHKNAAMQIINDYSELASSYTAEEQVAAQNQLSKIEKEAKQLARMKLVQAAFDVRNGNTNADNDIEFEAAMSDIINDKKYSDLDGYNQLIQGLNDDNAGRVTSNFKEGRGIIKASRARGMATEEYRQAQANKNYATRKKK